MTQLRSVSRTLIRRFFNTQKNEEHNGLKYKSKVKAWAEMRMQFPLTWFTAKEASLLLKVSTYEVHKLCREGMLKSAKAEGGTWIEPESLENLVMAQARDRNNW